MNKPTSATSSASENTERDSTSSNLKKPAVKEQQSDSNSSETDSNSTISAKQQSHFDYSNFGLFFNNKPPQPRSSVDSNHTRAASKKRSTETSFNKDSSVKIASSKENSNLDELCENTTVLSGVTDSKSHTKRRSDFSISKNQSEESSDVSQSISLENSILKALPPKKGHERNLSGLGKLSKEDKIEQDNIKSIAKLLNGESDEPEKADSSVLKDLKPPKANFDLKVIERIKTKINHRSASITQTEVMKNLTSPQSETRTNNTSLFTGPNRITKAVSPILPVLKTSEENQDNQADLFKQIGKLLENQKKKQDDSDELLFSPFSNVTPTANKNFEIFPNKTQFSQEKVEPIPRQISQPKDTLTLADSTLGSAMRKSETNPPIKLRAKPNLSLINTDIESDSISAGFNNFEKIDYYSPKTDSGRVASENSDIGSSHRPINPYHRFSLIQPQSVQAKLNHSVGFFGGYSGNNSDRSTNYSWNDDVVTSLGSNYSTPQNRHQQAFAGMPNKMLEQQFFLMPQSMPQNFGNNRMSGNFATPNQGSQTDSNRKYSNSNMKSTPSNSDQKNGSARMRKKTQDNEDSMLFEINLDKVESCGKTTLMVRNIPNKYDLNLILQAINKNFKGKFDFFYLPIDFRNKCNVGYAFINFIEPKAIKAFYTEFHGKKWEKFNSEKICDIKYARIQGLEHLIDHFQYSSVMSQQDMKLKPYIPLISNKEKIEELVERQRRSSGRAQNEIFIANK